MEHPVGTSVKMEFGGTLRKVANGRWTYDYYIGGCIRKKVSTKRKDLRGAMVVAERMSKVTQVTEASFGGAYESDYYDVYKNAKSNAQKKTRDFSLTLSQFQEIVDRSNGHCEVTGIKFQRIKDTVKYERQPFMPSLDRIDSLIGYTVDNCRLVCTSANYALSTWGDWVIYELAVATVKAMPKGSLSRLSIK